MVKLGSVWRGSYPFSLDWLIVRWFRGVIRVNLSWLLLLDLLYPAYQMRQVLIETFGPYLLNFYFHEWLQ